MDWEAKYFAFNKSFITLVNSDSLKEEQKSELAVFEEAEEENTLIKIHLDPSKYYE